MQQPLKVGLVGCGSVAQCGALPHVSLADARKKVHLAAVVDTVPERARQTAAWFTSVEEMLAGVEIIEKAYRAAETGQAQQMETVFKPEEW